jgi:hypothetical protein
MTTQNGAVRLLGAATWAAILLTSVTLMMTWQYGASASTAPDPANAPTAAECEGSACSAVTLTWEEEGQRFRVDNNSDSGVKVDVSTYAGDSSVHVEPHKSGYLEVKYFNGPYRADFE